MNVLHFKNNSQNRDVISLFSGAMGLDIGLAKAGLNIAIGQDFDAACVATMRANGHKVLSGDIRDIDPADLLEQVNLVFYYGKCEGNYVCPAETCSAC